MRHRKKNNKLSKSFSQRRALLRSLVRAFFINERIKTTTRRAKVVASRADRLITVAKRGDLHSRRIVYSFLNDHKLTRKLFDEIAPRFKDIRGGYTRIIKSGPRKGDGAELSILELVRRKEIEKKKPLKKKEEIVTPEEKKPPSLKKSPKKIISSRRSFRENLRKIFKKERDSL